MTRILSGAAAALAVTALVLGTLWWSGRLHLNLALEAIESSSPPDASQMMAGMDHSGHAATAAPDPAPAQEMAMSPDAMMEPMADMPEGAVMISPERQQLIGVRTAPVERQQVTREIRTVGRVDYDETRVAHIHTKVSGWIETLHVDFTGKLVEAGQPLLEIYSPELVATQEEYLLALRAQDSLGASPYEEVATTTRSLLAATRRRLLLWDVTQEQIAELERRREPQTTLTLYSPIEGFVIQKNAYEGQRVGPDDEMFSIADLSTIWVIADIYESDLGLVREGQRATISLSYLPARRFTGVVDYIYPYLEGKTRTAKARLVLANPDTRLKPDMYANVELTVRLGNSLVVPEDAVIDTGERQVVFLALAGGHFLAREVTAGIRFDGKLQILDGLTEGDVVVSGAAFLIDSESKLRSAVGMPGHQH